MANHHVLPVDGAITWTSPDGRTHIEVRRIRKSVWRVNVLHGTVARILDEELSGSWDSEQDARSAARLYATLARDECRAAAAAS